MKRLISALSSLCLAATSLLGTFTGISASAAEVKADAPAGTIVYDLVPHGKTYEAADEGSKGNNTVTAEPGETLTIDWTVKHDQAVAGLQMTLDFSQADYQVGKAQLGEAYMALPQFNDNTGTKGEIVYTFGQDEEETADDNAIIYSFQMKAPQTGSVTVGEKSGSNVFNKVISRVDKEYSYIFHGLTVKVDNSDPGTTPSSDEPKQTTPGQTVDIKDAIIYNLVPHGKKYTAVADNSTGNNTYNAEAGEELTIDWTVKKDQSVAGLQMTLDFSEVDYKSGNATLGEAYMAMPQFNDNTGTKGEIVYTFGQDEEETAEDDAIIYSFKVTAPKSGTASIGEKTGSNIYNKVISRLDKEYKYVFHGLDIVVGGQTETKPGSSDEPKQTTPAQTIDIKDTIIYNLVPHGKKYTAVADNSTGNNTYNAEAGEELTIDWTVKKDQSVAGIQMTLDFSEVNYKSGNATLGEAYMAMPQFNDNTGTKGEIVYTFGQDEEETAEDDAIIYSFKVTAPTSGTASIGEKTGSNIYNKVISRLDKEYKYVFHGLDIVVGGKTETNPDEPKQTTPAQTVDIKDTILYNLVPNGKKYTAVADNSTGNNVVEVAPNEEFTIDWTVKKDQSVAGIQMTLDFSEVGYTSGGATLGEAYMAMPQFNDNTGVKGEIVYTFGQDEEETAEDNAVIYSFKVKAPASGTVSVGEKTGSNIYNKVISRLDKEYKYLFHGLDIVVKDDAPIDPSGKIIYNLIPNGMKYTAADDTTSDPNVVEAATGSDMKIDWTVKQDQKVAGIQMSLDFSQVNYQKGKSAQGEAYMALPQFNDDTDVKGEVMYTFGQDEEEQAEDNAVIYSFNIKVPDEEGEYVIDERPGQDNKAISREDKSYPYIFHGLKIVAKKVVETTTVSTSTTPISTTTTVTNDNIPAGSVDWKIADVKAEPGATVKVPVTVKNDGGTAGIVAEFKYNDALEFTGIDWADGYTGEAKINNDDKLVVWASNDGADQKAKDGATVLNLNFKAPTAAGKYAVEFVGLEVTNTSGNALTVTKDNGSVTVEGTAGSSNWIIGEETVAPGARVQVPVTVNGDEGTGGFVAEFTYNENLKFDGFEWGDGYKGKATLNDNELVVVWADANGANQQASDGATVLYLNFIAPVTAGKYPVEFKSLEATNESGAFLTLTKENGAVIVTDPDAGSATWIIGEKVVEGGEQAKVPVTVKGDTGTAGFAVEFEYDDALTFNGFEWADGYTGKVTMNTNDKIIVWADANGANQKAADDAVVAYLLFTAPDEAGEYPVTFKELEVSNENASFLAVEKENGKVIVKDPDAGSANWDIGEKTVGKGASVKVPVTVKGDNGTAGFSVEFAYDLNLTLTGIEWGDAYTGKVTINQDEQVVVWADANGENQKATDDAVVLYLNFIAPDEVGKYPVRFIDLDASDKAGISLVVEKDNGWVEVVPDETTTTVSTSDTTPTTTSEEEVVETTTSENGEVITTTTSEGGEVPTTTTSENGEVPTTTTSENGEVPTTTTSENGEVPTTTTSENGEVPTTTTSENGEVPTTTTSENGEVPTTTTSENGEVPTTTTSENGEVPTTTTSENGEVPTTTTSENGEVPTTTTSENGEVPTTTTSENGEVITTTTSVSGTVPVIIETTTETTPVPDPGHVVYQIAKVEGVKGTTVKVPVYVWYDEGTAGFTMEFAVPDGFKISGVQYGDAYSGANGEFRWSPDENVLVWASADGANQKAADGATIVTLFVDIPKEAKSNTEYPVTFVKDSVSVSDTDRNLIAHEEIDGSITVLDVEPSDIVFGIGDASGEPGSQVTVPLTVLFDKGTNGFEITLDVPDGLTIDDLKIDPDSVYAKNGKFEWDPETKTLKWTSNDGKNVVPTPGTKIADITVGINDNADPGTVFQIGITNAKATNEANGVVNPSVVKGNVTVLEKKTETTTTTVTTDTTAPIEPTTTTSENGEVITTTTSENGEVPTTTTSENGEVITTTTSENGEVITTTTIENGEVPTTTTSENGEVITTTTSENGEVITTTTSENGEVITTTTSENGEIVTTTSTSEQGGEVITTSTSEQGGDVTTTTTSENGGDVTTTTNTSFKVVTSIATSFEKPTRVNYWSHDPRSFKESGGLDGLKFIITIYKYYVNERGLFVDENGLPVSGTPYDETDGIPETIKPISEKTLDATAYTHPQINEDGPLKVWKNEIIAQFGENYTEADELNAKHDNKYTIKAFYFPSEQDDPDFMLNGGEPLELGDWNIYIGVKGDVNLDNIADVADAQLVLNYYTSKVVAHKDIDIINVKDPVDPEFEGVDRLCYYLGDVKYKNNDGTMADPTSLDVEDAQMILNYYTRKYVAKKAETNWEGVVGYDLLDSFYGGVEEG